MVDKLISYNSCVSIFQPDLQRSFATISPLYLISGPRSTLFYSWAGSVSYISSPSVSFGTIDRWRIDLKDSQPLNRDQWTLNSTGTASLVRITDVRKEFIPNHYSDSLPLEINDNSPDWVKNLVREQLRKFYEQKKENSVE